MLRRVASVGTMVFGIVACSANESAEPENTTTTEAATTAAAPTTATVTSAGTVIVGDDTYELDVTCIAPGAGEVVAVGIGESTAGERVEAYVQAFLGEPYIGLEIGNTVLQPALDGTLDLYLQDDAIRASAIRFVTDLDLDTGQATFVGLGSVEIECLEYDEELPPTAFD